MWNPLHRNITGIDAFFAMCFALADKTEQGKDKFSFYSCFFFHEMILCIWLVNNN